LRAERGSPEEILNFTTKYGNNKKSEETKPFRQPNNGIKKKTLSS